MIKKVPEKLIAKQTNLGDMLGDFWSTYNIDLTSNLGKIRLSEKLLLANSSGAVATLVSPAAIVRNLAGSMSADTNFLLCNQAILTVDAGSDGSGYLFTADTLASSPTTTLSSTYSDMVTFNGDLIVSTTADLAKLSAGTWTNNWWTGTLGQPAFSSTVHHPLVVTFNNKLLSSRAGSVIASITYIDASYTVDDQALSFGDEYEAIWMRSSNSEVWIGTRHKYGGRAKIFMWDGYTKNFNADYKVDSDISLAGCIKDEICYTVSGNGQLLAFNGSGFTEVGRFPIANDKSKKLTSSAVHKNGMNVVNGNINILLNATTNAGEPDLLENMVSGIWEYTPDTGLYHKHSIVKGNESAIVDYGCPILNMAGVLYPLNSSSKRLFAGAQVNSAATSSATVGVLNMISGDNNNLGSFVSPKIYGGDIEEMWQKVWLDYEKLQASGYSVILKYRQSVDYKDASGFSQVGNWMTSLTSSTSATEFSTVSAGDEIEVISGEGSGLSANIESITEAGGVYAITTDTAVTNASGTFRYRISNWKKVDSITDLVSTNKEFGIGVNSNWIQFKIIIFGQKTEIEKLTIKSEAQLKAI